MSEQVHDKYVKRLLRQIGGNQFISNGPVVKVDYDGNISASIDGVIEGCCAFEVESRVPKQIRGALLDLLEHRYQKKLLILVPVHMYNPEATTKHCEYILGKYKQKETLVKVILLKGTGDDPKDLEDKSTIENALRDLGCI